MSSKLYSAAIQTEEDVVSVRRKAREIAALLGYDLNEQTRIATAVSEVARDAFSHAGGGAAEFSLDTDTRWFTIRISSKKARRTRTQDGCLAAIRPAPWLWPARNG